MASELKELLDRIEAECIAAQQGLQGLASGVARHDFITAKVRRVDDLYEQVEAQVGSETALVLVVNVMGIAETKCELVRLRQRLEKEGYGYE